MDWDLAYVIGIVLVAFAIPAIISALSDGRAPRTAAIAIMLGGGLVVLAIFNKPGSYSVASTPETFVQVVGRYLN